MAVSLAYSLVKFSLSKLAQKKRANFIAACKNPADTQAELKKLILSNALIPFPEKPTDFFDYKDKKKLTHEPISFYETTSGSTGNKKEIPYTQSLLKSYENMFLLWVNDLLSHSSLNFQSGKFFMSVSPKIGDEIKDDRKYLSPFISFLLTPFLVSNPNHHNGKTSQDFLIKISRDLINAKNLEAISIWSPTYLISLLDFIDKHRKELNIDPHASWKSLWPELKLISCWTHAQATRPAKILSEKFPGVMIQSKGLLLTESPITIPWTEAGGNVPLLTETYLEFMDSLGKIYLLHELKLNSTYKVLSSQTNGFLRYNTQDEVKVTGFYHKTPLLEFIGRSEIYCDLAGEKVSEKGVRDSFHLKQTYLLVPDTSADLPRYVLYIDEKEAEVPWENPLLENYHYKLARTLGQIRPLEVFRIKNLNQKYLEFCQSRGMTLGDIKEKVLIHQLAEAEAFRTWIAKGPQSSP